MISKCEDDEMEQMNQTIILDKICIDQFPWYCVLKKKLYFLMILSLEGLIVETKKQRNG